MHNNVPFTTNRDFLIVKLNYKVLYEDSTIGHTSRHFFHSMLLSPPPYFEYI